MTQLQRLEITAFIFLCLFIFLVAISAFFQGENRHEKFYCDRINGSYANSNPVEGANNDRH